MAENMHIPAIRFKGFNDEWVEMNLGDICEIGDIDHRMPPSVSDGIPYVMTGGFIGINELDFKNSKLISNEEYEQLSKKIKPEQGDVILARYASVGAVRYVETQLKFLVSYSCAILKLSPSNKGRYVFYYLKSNYSQNQIELEINTGSQRNIGIDSLKKLLIHLPNENEQLCLAKLFQNLDKLISLHQTKVNKLVNLKKAMLEKMFPKDGADVPEIRFKGFEGDWEEKRLGEDVADIVGGGTPSSFESSYWNGNIDWYSPTEIGTEVFANGSVKKITEIGLKNSSAKLLPANKTILFTSRAGIGDMAILKRIGATNQGFQSLVLKDGYDTYFIYSMGVLIKDFAIRYSSGSTFLEISGKMLGKMVLRIPSITEQKKIGAYFQNLDKVINLHQSELNKLNNLKKACLEKMFV